MTDSLRLVCGSCRTARLFEGSTYEQCAIDAHTEGWVYLSFSPIGRLVRTRIADLCPKCFSEIQYRLEPSTLTMGTS